MGSQLVYKKIKSEAMTWLIMGIVFTVFPTLLLLFRISTSVRMYVLCGIGILMGLVFLVMGIVLLADPHKHGSFKNNQYLLQMADELYGNVRYADEFIMISDRLIAVKNNVLSVTPLNEVYLAYIQKESTNFVPTGKTLTIANARGTSFVVNIYGKKREVVEQLVNTMASVCPYMRVGYTQENLAYVEEMRQRFRSGMPPMQ